MPSLKENTFSLEAKFRGLPSSSLLAVRNWLPSLAGEKKMPLLENATF